MTDCAVIERLAEAPDLLRLHRLRPERYPFLLQSTATDGKLGRFDVLFMRAPQHLVARDRQFLALLDEWYERERVAPADSDLPFTGGWFLFLGYGLAAEIEPGLELRPDRLLPTAFAVRCPAAIVYDHEERGYFLVRERDADVDVSRIVRDARRAAAATETSQPGTFMPPEVSEADPTEFLDAILRAKAYIRSGDIYQANLSRGWQARLDPDLTPGDLYAALRASNPAPFAGIARWQNTSIISSSPERLLRVRNGHASTRPIAGTRPRSADPLADNGLSAELFASPKERAEHVMLIDLERNDLGRVCEAGSVSVDEMMVLESYAHVHHIVSNVAGALRGDVSPGQAIAAVFPGGTITGCPKVRCMQIIEELEDGPRGAYTGSFGYLNRDGNLDLNILIRTMVMRDNHVTFRAGSGIVADSKPDAELEETRAKAKGMIRALPQ